MVRVAIAVGSNLGDREAHIRSAAARIRPVLSRLTVSTLVETEPVDVPDVQPPFLNGAFCGEFSGTPRQLLDVLMDIERECGRERPYPGAPRTLDLDLILFGDRVVDEPGLQIPHPRFRDRGFVLQPLAEIAPDAVDPVTQQSIGRLFEAWKEQRPCVSR